MTHSYPRPSIIGVGLSAPQPVGQSELADLAVAITRADAGGESRTRKLYESAQIDSRGALLARDNRALDLYRSSEHARGPTTAERMRFYEDAAPPLAHAAAVNALDDAGASPSDITHLITVSCTGFAAPGIERALIDRLGLSPNVERTNVGFMGCHGALNALRIARAISLADPTQRILIVAVEICSAHFSYDPTDERRLTNALFADGAAAAVVAREPGLAILSTGSRIIPDSERDMRWEVGDHGFEMTLSRRVPALIREHLAPWLEAWLAKSDRTTSHVGQWAIHPGGAKILDAAVDALKLPQSAADPSRLILRERGNMSSPTILFILDRLRRDTAQPTACLAFGPGLTVEATLLQ